MRRRQPCRQQTEGRAGDVVEADLVAELDGLWIAAVLAADANLEGRPRVASLGRGHLHQQPNARLVKGGKWILFEDACLHVSGQEVVDVVSRNSESRLGQIVRAEAEELSLLSYLVGGEGRSEEHTSEL